MRRLIQCLVFPLLIVLHSGGCSRAPSVSPHKQPTAGSSESNHTVYQLTGIIRSVDRETGQVMIQHDEIPGYMPAMTMPFNLLNDDSLQELEQGDRIAGNLKIEGDRSRLTGVYITEPADPTDRAQPVEPPPSLILAPGSPVPDFLMTTQENREIRLSDLRGHPVVLTFIYTRCPLPEFCPLLDRKFADLARKIVESEGQTSRVRLLSISFDPEHDTPSTLATHARRVGARPPLWLFAVAAHDELLRVAEPLGLSYSARPNEIAHTLSTAVISSDGRLLHLFQGNQWSCDDVLTLINNQTKQPAPSQPAPANN